MKFHRDIKRLKNAYDLRRHFVFREKLFLFNSDSLYSSTVMTVIENNNVANNTCIYGLAGL